MARPAKGLALTGCGRRRVLLLGLTGFGLASLAGGFAQDPGQLVATRAAQGIGAAAVAPTALCAALLVAAVLIVLTALRPATARPVRTVGQP